MHTLTSILLRMIGIKMRNITKLVESVKKGRGNGDPPPKLKISSKPNSPVTIVIVFTKEYPGSEKDDI